MLAERIAHWLLTCRYISIQVRKGFFIDSYVHDSITRHFKDIFRISGQSEAIEWLLTKLVAISLTVRSYVSIFFHNHSCQVLLTFHFLNNLSKSSVERMHTASGRRAQHPNWFFFSINATSIPTILNHEVRKLYTITCHPAISIRDPCWHDTKARFPLIGSPP